MPFAHDLPNCEASVDQHDREAVVPGSTEGDRDQVLLALTTHQAPDGPLLDIGCGSGRHIRALADCGRGLVGVDIDEQMLTAARNAGLPPHCQLIHGDASELTFPEPFAAAMLLNRGLTCFHSHRQAWGLFTNIARHLKPGGLFIIDNVCRYLWAEIANGNYSDGLASDLSEQLFFLPGENRFVWRRGDAVDPDSWAPKPNDRIFRLWSLNEVALAAAGARLELLQISSDDEFIILRSPTDRSQHMD